MNILASTKNEIREVMATLNKSLAAHRRLVRSEEMRLATNREMLEVLRKVKTKDVQFYIALRRNATNRGAVFVKNTGSFPELLRSALKKFASKNHGRHAKLEWPFCIFEAILPDGSRITLFVPNSWWPNILANK